jgi:hypothetical protein
MCYEYDDLFEQARLAEQIRRERKVAEELAKRSGTTAPAKPAEPQKEVKEQPVPA